MKTVLVTGAAGFIGSNFSKRVLEMGHKVVGVDDMSNGFIEFVPKGVELLQSSFDVPTIMSAVYRQEFDAVVHFAANPRASYSVERPLETHDVNLTKTLKLAEACAGNTERFVFASSSSVYGDQSIPSVEDETRIIPVSPYGLQKATAEQYIKMLCNFKNLEACSLRIFNAFGPNQLGTSAYSCAITSWLTAIMNGEKIRSDGDGTQSRDMCYVDDVVDAFELAMTHAGKLHGDAINVGTGARYTNNEIIEHLQSIYEVEKYDAPARPGDAKHTQASTAKAAELLGFKAKTSLFDGIAKTTKWFEDEWDMISGLNNKL